MHQPSTQTRGIQGSHAEYPPIHDRILGASLRVRASPFNFWSGKQGLAELRRAGSDLRA